MSNHKRKKFRWAGKIMLKMKYWHRGMSKTNYREHSKRARKALFA